MKGLFAELYGRETGSNGGKAGSQDISMSSVNFYSGAILAGAVAIAVGAAIGFQLKRVPRVAVAGFGEGATEEGIFWEAINYAALNSLPVVFLCENNLYSTYAHQLKHQFADNLTERVKTFGVKSCALYGNDVVAVHAAVERAVNEARAGAGPWFIEAYTYRWHGHVGPESDDDIGYRPKDEVEAWKANCPIKLLEEKLCEAGLLTEMGLAALVAEIDAEIDEAFQFAKSSPFPGDPDWTQLNYAAVTPLADRLLHESKSGEFDQNQNEAIPAPY
jgi:pyruvate dehydrogenase E1 component alpha subunit